MKKAVYGMLIVTMLLGTVMLVRTASPPEIYGVWTLTAYAVVGSGSEQWGQGMILQVTDSDGLNNLLIDGKISITIRAPDGFTYPLPTDGFFVTANPETNNLVIQWYNEPLSQPPVLGSYEITVTDRDGLSTTYITQPTLRVSNRVPTICYPPNFGIIHETKPTFIWEAFSTDAEYRLEVVFRGETIWASHAILPGQFSCVYDGPELARGETYGLHLFVFEDETVGESEFRRVISRRAVSFTVGPSISMATIDLHPEALNLASRGEYVTAYVELPAGYDVADINVLTVMLNDTVRAEPQPTAIGDYDRDGIPDLMMKFDRAKVEQHVLNAVSLTEKFTTVTLTIAGRLNDETQFQGSATIKIVVPSPKGARAFSR